jgi:short-subunit dehydrogenase
MKKDTALIVGLSSGAHFELVAKLAQNGHHLILVGPAKGELEIAAEELRRLYRAEVRCFVSDLTGENAVSDICREVQTADSTVEILVNNVSVKACEASRLGPPGGGDAAHQAQIDAVMRLTRLFVLPMIGRGHGRVMTTLSITPAEARLAPAGCEIARDFVLSLTRLLATELADTGIDVTALYPDSTNPRYFQVIHFDGHVSPLVRPGATILSFTPEERIPDGRLFRELLRRFGRGFFNFGRVASPPQPDAAVVPVARKRNSAGPRQPARRIVFGAEARGGSRIAIANRTDRAGVGTRDPAGPPYSERSDRTREADQPLSSQSAEEFDERVALP